MLIPFRAVCWRNNFHHSHYFLFFDQSEGSAVQAVKVAKFQPIRRERFVIVWAGAVNNKSDKFLTLDSVAKFGFWMFQKSHSYK